MNYKCICRGGVGLAALVLIAAAVKVHAQMMPGLGGFGLGTPWSDTVSPLQGPGFVAVNAGVAYTDNSLLTPTAKRSDEIGTAGVNLNYRHQAGQLNVTGFGNLDWEQYLHHSFSPGPYGNLVAAALWGKESKFLQLHARDVFGESKQNPLAATTLANLEYVNSLEAGPTFNFNIRRKIRLSLHGLYENTVYQRSPFSSQSYDDGATLTVGLSPVSSLSVDADDLRTEFNRAGIAPTYDTRSASLKYEADFPRTRLTASGGYSENNYSGGNKGAPEFSLRITRQIGPYASIYISGRTGYSTLGQSMTSNLSAPIGGSVLSGTVPYSSSPAPFKEDFGSVGWHFNRFRTSVSLAASIGRRRYDQNLNVTGAQPSVALQVPTYFATNPLSKARRLVRPIDLVRFNRSTNIDNTFEAYSASLTRKLRPTLILAIRGYFTGSQYNRIYATTIMESYALSLTRRFRRTALSLYVSRTHYGASAGSSGLAVSHYDADAVGFTVAYNLIAPGSGQGSDSQR